MDGPHQYVINLKKDDLFINLSSDDVYFISKQMDKWARILLDDSYIPINLPPWPTLPAPAASVAVAPPVSPLPAPVAEAPVSAPEPAPAPQPEPIPTPVPVTPPEPVAENPAPPVSIPEAVTPVPVQTAVSPPPVVPNLPSPDEQPTLPEAAQASQWADVDLPMANSPHTHGPTSFVRNTVTPPVQTPVAAKPAISAADGFEAVMDSVMKDLDTDGADDEILVAMGSAPQLAGHSLPEPAYELLAEFQPSAAQMPVTRPYSPPPAPETISSLADLCDNSHADSVEEFLLLAAYYLTQFEQEEMYSLKKLNSALVKAGHSPVNHSVLEIVLMQGNLAMVPDLTGTADVSQYTITPEGQDKVRRLF